MIRLGDKVQDTVSGVIGIVCSKIEHLNGCIQYGVQPKLNKNDDEIKVWNIDEEQLKIVKPKTVKVKKSLTGGATKLANKRY